MPWITRIRQRAGTVTTGWSTGRNITREDCHPGCMARSRVLNVDASVAINEAADEVTVNGYCAMAKASEEARPRGSLQELAK